MKFFVSFLLAGSLLIFGCNHPEKKQLETKPSIPVQDNPYKNSTFDIKTYSTNNGWGYDVYVDGNLYIHQPTIPAVQGNRTFKTEDDARKTAQVSVHKIKNNIVPPSITTEELDSLGVLK